MRAGHFDELVIDAERAESHSLLRLYRRLIALRHAELALAIGEYMAAGVQGDLLVYGRIQADRRLRMVLNLSARPQPYVSEGSRGRIVLSTHLDRAGEQVSGRVTLRSNEGLILASV
jgi:alpha-glucosidase